MYNRERANVRRTQGWSWLNPLERGCCLCQLFKHCPLCFYLGCLFLLCWRI